MNPADLKPLFIEWLEQLAAEANHKGSRAATLYSRLLLAVRHYDGPIVAPTDLRKCKFIGAKTLDLLSAKLRSHCAESNVPVPEPFRAAATISAAPLRPKRAPSAKQYIPRHRLGGYAILLALYSLDLAQRGISRERITAAAGPHADKSFASNPSARDFHSAWLAIKILTAHDLVCSMGRAPKLYALTDEGKELASHLHNSLNEKSDERGVSMDTDATTNTDGRPLSTSACASVNASARAPTSISTAVPVRAPIPVSTANDSFDTLVVSPQQQKLVHDPNRRIFDGIKYSLWPPGSYEVVLIIDTREVRSRTDRDFFLSRLEHLGVACEVRPLAVGDAIWIVRHIETRGELVLNYACERKKLDDLAFSIKDGRFQEQKHRLKQMGAKHIFYLVEEGGLDRAQQMSEQLNTAIAATFAVHKFLLRRFKDIDETVLFLASTTMLLQEKMQAGAVTVVAIRPRALESQQRYRETLLLFRTFFENGNTNHECCHSYAAFNLALTKTSETTVRDMYLLMLMAVRGVLLERAIQIQKIYPTPRSLLEAYLDYRGNHRTMLSDKLLHLVGNKKIGVAVLLAVYEAWGVAAKT